MTTTDSTPLISEHDRPAAAHPTAILAIILVSYFMIILDISIVLTGLPQIRVELGFSTVGLAWVQNAYLLVFGGLMLLGARAGDLLGRRRMFMIGLSVFTAASLVIGAAPSAALLLVGRAAQGLGAAVLVPSTLALLTSSFREGPERTRAVAAYGAVAGIGASVGLVLGGVFADLFSWRSGFLINVPIGIALILAARRYLAETPRVRGRFDVIGALCSTLGMGALVFGILHGADSGWGEPLTIAAFAAGVVLLTAFVLYERPSGHPIMPLRLFRSRARSGAYGVRMLFVGAMMAYFFFLTQFLQEVFGFTPLVAGLAFLPMTVVNFAVALAVPRLTRRFGNATLLIVGIAVTLVGMAWLSRLGADSAYLTDIALPMVFIGIGQGLAFAPMTAAGISGVPRVDAGAASGLVNASHQLGGSLGLGILTAVGVTSAAGATGADEALAQRVSGALTGGSVLLALALAVSVVCIARMPRRGRARRPLTEGFDAPLEP
ncbi:MFS transporter [Agromyces sp. Soil535]|uniref:MFS transporter n=1 Tax=Agromyces sp. Soil535 TaxID=1736390 RepID=UPI0006FE04D5|nr:MFS transporter [Agromyces sp. Soil535]KRE29603.1 MFS transporter [Agromyces sp. Soil535]